ncbi:HlyD family efflux transporter periplasmic adaptor subunit [Hyphomicrobium sp.]|uniref:efflux RND transporter periplasmic adaptor subunit n=1 Tax=Hyphomicrobium sp. TaxID=82 RepID=UPI0025C3C52A|nr:HlyD family efflux transporter periplasmic adaptor subunit [Hyphomicrobium sp.]MCC7251876.1 efflux RND transporter periplasmic adaptor subunit [Hyphomicrobium sp.]
MTRLATTLFAGLVFGLTAFSALGHAHGDDDHSRDAAASATPAAPRLVAESSELELVATATERTLTIYLDSITTTAPVDGAKIDVMGEGIPAATAKEVGNGTYELEADWVHEPGTKALTFTVATEGSMDLLAGMLVISVEAEESGAVAGWRSLLARPELWLLALTIGLGGFFLGFAFRPARLPPDDTGVESAPSQKPERSLRNAAEIVLIAVVAAAALPDLSRAHEGHDHGEAAAPAAPGSGPVKLPNGEVFLPKPTQRLLHVRTAPAVIEKAQSGTELIGTVIADPAHEGRVQAPMDGQIELAAGSVSYVGKKVEAGEVLVLLAPAMPVYERGTLAQVTADVEGKLRIAEQKLARLTRISGEYIPQREIDDTKEEIASLREQKRVLEPKNTERLELKAPVSGIISVATVRPGQVVSARDTLFEIVDPKRLWIEAIGIHGTDDENPVSAATAVDAEGHRIPLTFVGRAPALRQQALPLLFSVDEPHASLGIGGTVKVLIRHGAPVEGIVLPDAAVVRAPNGLPQVWIKVAPERFAARPVRTAPLDGERVVVMFGLAKGDRVVVEAAELINQVR